MYQAQYFHWLSKQIPVKILAFYNWIRKWSEITPPTWILHTAKTASPIGLIVHHITDKHMLVNCWQILVKVGCIQKFSLMETVPLCVCVCVCVYVYSGLTSFSTFFQSYHDGVWLRQGAQCSLLKCCLTEVSCPRHLTWYYTQSHYPDTGSTSPSSTP